MGERDNLSNEQHAFHWHITLACLCTCMLPFVHSSIIIFIVY